MMVTFVSQCQKKALNRTRRVLDAFANRIGDNTWQTIITEDGLIAVKTLLRKTATKNTAVACHWIRSRSRSELIWMVGNKNKFNEYGHVPVNYTSEELIMEKITVKTDSIFANTKRQPLDQHLFAVGFLAYSIVLDLTDDKSLAFAAFIAGCMHDIGKVEPIFQEWLFNELKKNTGLEVPEEGQHIERKTKKVSPKDFPRHNETSLMLFKLLNRHKFQNDTIQEYIEHAIYWHHAKWLRDKDFSIDMIYNKLKKNIEGEANLNLVFQVISSIVSSINEISEDYFMNDDLVIEEPYYKISNEQIDKLEKEPLPEYKTYTLKENIADYKINIAKNAKKNLIRNAVITSDRQVSKITAEQLNQHIDQKTLKELIKSNAPSNLIKHIEKCLHGFEYATNADMERNKQQSLAAIKLSKIEEDVSAVKVLQGPAGCGKTKIALEWAARAKAKQIIWICPRVQICQGLINDLTADNYLPNAKIEIFTGEFKKIYSLNREPYITPKDEVFSGDVVITTIDQIINSIITHRHITTLSNYMEAHVVFDEFHEYINMPAFNLLFAELVKCKALQKEKAKAILVSATPNFYFVKEFLDIDQEDIVFVPSFNHSRYELSFVPFDDKKQDADNQLYGFQNPNTFVISNTATNAQQSFIVNQQHEKAILLHAKFKKSDKELQFKKAIDSFKQNGSHEYDLVRSGPIIQASLNISCGQMITEFTYAENWLQRLGRLNRFGEAKTDNRYISAITDAVKRGKQIGSCAKNLDRENGLQGAKAWYNFLEGKLENEQTYTLSEIYTIYKEFYESPSVQSLIEQDFMQALKKSIAVIDSKLIDPIDFPHKKPLEDKVKLTRNSLRGDSLFVQMALCNVENIGVFNVLNQYCCNENDITDVMTLPTVTVQPPRLNGNQSRYLR